MSTKTIKFIDVPIGARFKYLDDAINTKITNEKYHYLYNEKDIVVRMYETLTEVELITKCENCKFKSNSLILTWCDKLDVNIEENSERNIGQNIETFSCSLFEMKEEEYGNE